MTAILDVFRNEPTAAWGAIGALVTAGIALGVAFGLHLSEPQATAINVFVATLGTLVTLFVIRSQTTPTAKVAASTPPTPAVTPTVTP